MARREAVLVGEGGEGIARWDSAESFVMARIRSALCVPLIHGGEIHGVLQIDNGSSPCPFEKADLDLVRWVAPQIGMAIAYARLYANALERSLLEHDLLLARKVQQHFLPERPPAVPGFSVTVDYVPALGVSGDFYDFLPLGADRIGVVLGDVSGKGVSAALYAARIGSELRYIAATRTEPAEILTALNATFAASSPDGMFATMVLIAVDVQGGRLAVANAGHPPPLVRVSASEIRPIGGAGQPPIGVTETVTYRQQECTLEAGQVLALYTDGVSEALDTHRRLFGDEGLARVMRASSGGAEVLRRTAMREVTDWVAGVGFSDDVTLLCVSRE
jgi:sigma-B regulation protein RsbU (phosphoserine phosphatase)